MTYITVDALQCSCVVALLVSLLCTVESEEHVANGTLARGRAELNLPMVLNTTLPLYLYYTCDKIMGLNDCNATNCITETDTCEHMRMKNLTYNTYNFTLSELYNFTTWKNTSYTAEFIFNKTPPIEMMYNTTTTSKRAIPYRVDMKLTFNEPDTYNCSVFTVTYVYGSQRLVGTKTSMYIRGRLPTNTTPELYCEADFFTHCYNTTIYKPYNSNCTVNETSSEDEQDETCEHEETIAL
uniref:Putative secreted peptide n=1 Tax=Rhipicephalus pulchellus TaxID=72859 RepID=L7MBQ6_RHIPC